MDFVLLSGALHYIRLIIVLNSWSRHLGDMRQKSYNQFKRRL